MLQKGFSTVPQLRKLAHIYKRPLAAFYLPRPPVDSEGDPFVIATAQIHTAIVVTGERPSGKLSKPKIPDVCQALGMRCIRILGLIQAEKWSF